MDVVIDEIAAVSRQVDLVEAMPNRRPDRAHAVIEPVVPGALPTPEPIEQALLVDRDTEGSELKVS